LASPPEPFAGSTLLRKVVIPALGQAEHAFSAALARINVEDLAHSAAALTPRAFSVAHG